MTDELALMNDLRSNDQDVRIDAQTDLAAWLRDEPNPSLALTRGVMLAHLAVTERQRRIYSALLGDIATPATVPFLVVWGNEESIAGTVARRAFRRFCDHALPPDEAAALSLALEWCDRNRASAQLVFFLCERVMEAAVKRPTLELCAVQAMLEKLVARKTWRRAFGRAWMIRHFEETLASLKPLLPAASLPRPSRDSSLSNGSLPRPADLQDPLSKNLPLSGEAKSEPDRRKIWWRQ